MINYNKRITNTLEFEGSQIPSFIRKQKDSNIDWKTVDSFGDEWTKFESFTDEEIEEIGNEYFDIVDDEMLNKTSVVLDIGCGTGRWTRYAAKRAGFIEAIDPSHAVYTATKLLQGISNIRVTQAEVSSLPFNEGSFDFVFSLGVLHHIPDTQQAMKDAVKMLKKDGYFLVYLYYDLDNRGMLFRSIFYLSNILRLIVNKLPQSLKAFACDILAFVLYLPLVSLSRLVKRLFPKRNWYRKIPLSSYTNKSFKVMRNDSLDRFGTPLEQRFTKKEIIEMMEQSGLKNITFSPKDPYWHAVGQKK